MRIYTRKKPRQTGKTTDLINIAKVFLNYNRRIIIVCLNRNMHVRIKHELSKYEKNGNIIYALASNTDSAFRGQRFNVILVDDWNLLSPRMQENININAVISNSSIWATES